MPTQKQGRPGFVRIIGGTWRRRRLTVPEVSGLRPTGDRIRETVFSWLRQELPGARCLDLFAGSGALGFEAASRGAAEVVLIDSDSTVVSALQTSADELEATQIDIIQADALQWLAKPGQAFDVVFFDPPFGSALLERACSEVARGGWLAPRGLSVSGICNGASAHIAG